MKRPHSNQRRANSRAFTLLELIVVLVVLAALASMVIPTLGFVKDQSDTATAAATAQEVLNNLEIFKASTGRYPNRLETMVNTDGDYYSRAYGTSAGLFPYGTIGTGGFAYYGFNNGGGMTEVANHDETATDPNNSGVVAPLNNTTQFCVIDATQAQPFYESKARRIVNTCFPNQADRGNPIVPDNHTLIALAVGNLNGAVGSTMTDAPLCPEKSGSNPDNYDRFIAVFDVDFSGGGATGRGQVKLKCVLDSEYNVVATNLRYYKNSGPNDSLGEAEEEE